MATTECVQVDCIWKLLLWNGCYGMHKILNNKTLHQ